jgi:hypothetical protein
VTTDPIGRHQQAKDEPGWYEIRLEGRLDDRWASWFDDLTLTRAPGSGDGSILRGKVADQSALHGHLARLRDLGLPLVSVTRVVPPGQGAP